MSSFGDFLKKSREMRGWTQTDLGAKLGINSTAICRIENGSQKFSKSKIADLSALLNIDMQTVKDLFFADKFAREAYVNHCSDSVFEVAENTIKYLQTHK